VIHLRRLLVSLIVLLLALLTSWVYDYWREHRFDAEIAAAGRRYQIEPALIKAVIWRESWFGPDKRGRADEVGLMQVREAAALEWASAEHIVAGFNLASCLDPATNTLAGAWYLKKLMLRYQPADNPIPYALADYNAGRSNVLKWRTGSAVTNSAAFVERIGFPGTRAYVRSVMRRYEQYGGGGKALNPG